VSQDGSLFVGLNILISTVLSLYTLMVFKVNSFSLSYTIINFFFASYLLKTLLRIPFFVIGSMFSGADLSLLQGKCARNNLSLAVSGIILQNHRRLPVSIFSVKITTLWYLKRVTIRISNLASNFKGGS
jgi:hypothetical protein